MARKTPDYTRQARKKKVAARPPARGARTDGQKTAPKRGPRRPLPAAVGAVPAVPGWLLLLAYLGCVAAIGCFIYGAVAAYPDLGLPGIPGRDAIVAFAGMLAGLVTALLVLLLVNAILDPGRRVLPGIDERLLLYAGVFFGMFAGLLALSARVHIAVLGTGYTLVLMVFFLAVRPRMQGARVPPGTALR